MDGVGGWIEIGSFPYLHGLMPSSVELFSLQIWNSSHGSSVGDGNGLEWAMLSGRRFTSQILDVVFL